MKNELRHKGKWNVEEINRKKIKIQESKELAK